jgi:hypothetical protein
VGLVVPLAGLNDTRQRTRQGLWATSASAVLCSFVLEHKLQVTSDQVYKQARRDLSPKRRKHGLGSPTRTKIVAIMIDENLARSPLRTLHSNLDVGDPCRRWTELHSHTLVILQFPQNQIGSAGNLDRCSSKLCYALGRDSGRGIASKELGL